MDKEYLKDISPTLPLPKQVKIKDPVTGKEIMQNTKTGRTIQQVSIEPMDAAKEAALEKH